MRELWVFLYSTTRYGGSHRCVDMMIYHFTGHPQQEHETRHGSMSHTWTVNGPDHTARCSSKAEGSSQTTRVSQWRAICFVKHWIVTHTSTTVVPIMRLLVLETIRFSTFTNAFYPNLIVPRITLLTVCSGKGVVCIHLID